eukprot:10087073-Alexandrium_andersonii.AAC.1
MSASLVGSEMCIRDRERWAFKQRARSLFSSVSASLGLPLRCRALPGATPVSYTHLTLPTICSV